MALNNGKLTVEEEDQGSEDLGYASNMGLTQKAAEMTPEKQPLKALGEIDREDGTVKRRRSRWQKVRPRGEKLLMTLTIAGVLIGIVIGFSVKYTTETSKTTITLIKFPGELLMRMLKMLIIPIIITSVVTGLANLDMKKSGRMGAHAIIYYLATTTIAVILGIILVTAIHPGNKSQRDSFELGENKKVSTLDTYLDLLRNLFPDNIIAACFELVQTKVTEETVPVSLNTTFDDVFNNTSNITIAANESLVQNSTNLKISKRLERIHNPNVLGVIAFFVAFGITLSSLGEKGKPLANIFNILNEILMKMIMIVIWYSPVGICSLIAGNIVQLDNLEEIGQSLGLYMVTVITGLLIHGLFILPLIYFVMTRQNPYKFAYGLIQALLTALGTGSRFIKHDRYLAIPQYALRAIAKYRVVDVPRVRRGGGKRAFIVLYDIALGYGLVGYVHINQLVDVLYDGKVVTVITGLLIHGLFILPLIYFVMTRQNPYKFAYGLIQALLTALGTGSSAGTLPVTMRCLENNLGIDKRVTRFVLPIGATMNMDGTALLEGVASITIAQMYNLTLTFGQIVTISLTATVASIGAAAIPSAGLVTLLLVLTAIGIPTEAVAILWSIDWFLDRLRTAINVFGDCIGAGIVYHKNKEHLRFVDSQEKLRANFQNECGNSKEQSPLPSYKNV